MDAGRSFKTDESFLEKLAIGACGTRRVLQHLADQGLRPIELERGSTGYKIWKAIKIKRIRVPDILCLTNGVRIESRAKTKLMISMSHSSSDEARGWDYGLKDEDFVALVECSRVGPKPTDWQASELVQYFGIRDLRKAYEEKRVSTEKAKGAEEGFEIRITWPASVAGDAGTITALTKDRLQYRRQHDARTISLALTRKGITLRPHVTLGSVFPAGKILASVVSPTETIPQRHPVSIDDFVRLLNSTSIAERYTAAKAFSHIGSTSVLTHLLRRIQDQGEHIYVKLEAAACLARHQKLEGYIFIEETIRSEYLPHRLEAVIVLSEIKDNRAADLLRKTLSDDGQDSEIRAGAAWSLGELASIESLTFLVSAFNNVAEVIRIEAARALSKIAQDNIGPVLSAYATANETTRPGIAWALSRQERIAIDDILRHTPQESIDARQWTSFVLGSMHSDRVIGDIERLKQDDPEVYFAVTLLWKIMTNWVFKLEVAG